MPPLPLFMESAPHSGGKTSRDAAADIKPHVSTLRAKVLACVAACGAMGATAQELEAMLNLSGNTIRPRLVELRETKCIADSGETRRTSSGRKAVVWRLA